jgi:hypothetical protein
MLGNQVGQVRISRCADCRARSRIAFAFVNGFDSFRARHLILVDICQACARTWNRENARPTQSTATGFLFSKFRACSNANAICSTPQSSWLRPTICIPIGSPLFEYAHGTDAAGFPVTVM